ncbi:hypothetical protein B6V73_09850 [Thioclava sp. JM3]|uniref:hypothetical protein n=1 Tax=Thioclava sp. JM3 TaxID=1973004 RepID=UPI000B5418F2|nr:hypothetical protein [Thioclava sp. JM3]OWY17133.1 hypothetical protein B6V73_09850 [Thioclava sp. JM3]
MIPICYVSSEGKARNAARHIAATGGQGVELLPLSESGNEVDLSRFSGVILAASVDLSHYQSAPGEFVGAEAGPTPIGWSSSDGGSECAIRSHMRTLDM